MILHVNEVDDDQTGHVAQAQLAGNFARCFKIGGQRGLFDTVLLGRTTRVDVDRDQCFGRVDDDIAARFQLDDRLIHRIQLVFDMVTLEQRHRIGIMLHLLGVARHQEFHEFLGRPVTLVAFDKYFVNILVVDIADRAFDEVAVRMDQHWCRTFERILANSVPEPRKIIKVAFNLWFGPGEASSTDDAAHR